MSFVFGERFNSFATLLLDDVYSNQYALLFAHFVCCYHFDITVSWWKANNNQTIDAAFV